VVTATIGKYSLGTSAWTPGLAGDRADSVDQRQELRHVVAVTAGQADRKRNAVRVGDQVVL
jgi:hypothetical protein